MKLFTLTIIGAFFSWCILLLPDLTIVTTTLSKSKKIAINKLQKTGVTDSFNLYSINLTAWNKILKKIDSDSNFKPSKLFNYDWKRLQQFKLNRIHNFKDTALPYSNHCKKILYPFSGPDFLFASSFFESNAVQYDLIGLEPCGSFNLSEKDSIPNTLNYEYITQLYRSLNCITRFSFFRTLSMENELNSSYINGTLHGLIYLIFKQGGNPISYTYFKLNDAGQIMYTKSESYGLELTFKNQLQKKCTLRYISTNLENTSIEQNKGLLNYLSKGMYDVCYLKGASYLLHTPLFSKFKNLILTHSNAVLQDDSGLPIAAFLNSTQPWKIQLFGSYHKPISLFKNKYQKDLDSLYKNSKPLPLGFGLGYNFKDQNSALILAEKIKH